MKTGFRLLFFLAIALLLAGAVSAMSGSGTEDDPYVIQNCNNLDEVRNEPDAHYILGDNIRCNNFSVAPGFLPIGSSAAPFTGSFDGDEKTISDLYIMRAATDYVGLFGVISTTAEIMDLHVDGDITGDTQVGILVGVNNGSIVRCSSSNVVRGASGVGGLVGNNNGTVEDSFSTALVTGNVVGVWRPGGLVGYNAGTIYRSYASGDITAGMQSSGGLVGENTTSGIIECCYATGNVSTTRGEVGGLVGWHEGTIAKSYATGNVSGRQEHIGGLVGYVPARVGHIVPEVYILQSYAEGDARSTTMTQVGGLIGMAADTYIRDCYSKGTATGGAITGGIAGELFCTGSHASFNELLRSYSIETPLFGEDGLGVYCTKTGNFEGGVPRAESVYRAAGWDFENVWDIDPAINDGYPFFRWSILSPVIESPEGVESPSGRIVTIEEGESVNFEGAVGCVFVDEYEWVCTPSGTCPEEFPSYIEDPGEITFNTEGTYTITFKARDVTGWGDADTVTITVVPPGNVRFVMDLVPESVKQGQDFCRPGDDAAVCPSVSEIYLENLGSSPVSADVTVRLLDAATHQDLKEPDFTYSFNNLAGGNKEDITTEFLTWLDAPSLGVGNYILSAEAKEPGAGDVLSNTEKRFSILLAGRALPVPELDVLLLPALVAVVLFVLWKKNERLIGEKEAKLVNKGIELEMQGMKQGKVKTKSFAAIKKKYKL